jgi:quercetin dioxygenase-like cupin family protein
MTLQGCVAHGAIRTAACNRTAWYDGIMSFFADYGPPDSGVTGFRTVAGAGHGLSRLLLVVGRLLPGEVGPVHLHFGEEVLHVVSGRLLIKAGDDRHECGPDAVIAVPAGIWHGFRVLEETVLEVVAEQRIGTVYPVRCSDGHVDLVEVYRTDMPWGRLPPDGTSWTPDTDMRRILDSLDMQV